MQCAVFLGIAGMLAFLCNNLFINMEGSGLSPGFAFLWQPANFAIGESLISYEAQDSFGRAIGVGILNTLLVSGLGCVLATVVGVALGIIRLSSNPVASGLVRGYVEIVRNTPLLLQLFFWSALAKTLPAVRQAPEPVPGVILSNRGIYFPDVSTTSHQWGIYTIGVVIAAVLGWLLASRLLGEKPRSRLQVHVAVVLAAVGLFTIPIILGGFDVTLPARKGFNIAGGLSLSPEFAILLIGLVVNASAGIAEIVRSGIQAVDAGQWEAGHSLGLKRGQTIRLIVLPQAMRIAVPLLISSYLSLTKNSSLAVAIGYPDLVSIVNTAANQAGHALEAIVIMMVVYLAISLAVSWALNAFHRRFALVGR